MLHVRHLEKIIGGHIVLALDSLEVAAGEILAVIGPSGSGKTVLIQMLAGLLPPSGGTIALDEQPILFDKKKTRGQPGQQETRNQIGVLFTEDLLYERQSVRNNLVFYCRLRGLPVNQVDEILALVGLSDHAQQNAAKLSASAQRRLAFARALLGKPRMLLLDQANVRADLDTQELFARLIQQSAEAGAVVIMSDEDLAWASKFCTHVIELQDGHVTTQYEIIRNGEQENKRENEHEAPAPERFTPFKVPARAEDRILLYDPGDILYATSRDGKTYLRTATTEALTNFTLQELEGRLSGRGFFKAHRAYLVNLQHVKAVIQFTRNSYILQLDDKQETNIPLSRQSEKALQDILGY